MITHALEVADRLAADAVRMINETAGRRAQPTVKEHPYDWVTETDRTIEQHTRRVLAAEFPDIPVIGEEFGADGAAAGAPLHWVVDPVDGTANYVSGLRWCAYSLALVDTDGPLVGVVAHPYLAESYAAARGHGLSVNGRPVPGSPRRELAGGLICTELTRGGPWRGMGRFMELAGSAHVGVRILGSTALAVAQVALGRAGATILDRYREWDVAGALALASEAGAVVLDRDGNPDPLPTDGLLVAAPEVAAEVLDWWRDAGG